MPRYKRRRRQNHRHDPVTSAPPDPPTAQDDVTPLIGSVSPAASVSSSESTVIAATSTDASASVSSLASASTVMTEDVGATPSTTTASPARSPTQNHVGVLVEVGDQPNNANYDSDPEIAGLLREIFGDTPAFRERPGSTVININGYQYTRSAHSRVRTTYRCSFYRRLSCRGRCELMAGANTFTNFVPHTCQTAAIIQAAETNVQSQMEERVDVLAVTELSQTANDIWRRINSEFYLGSEGAVVVGLTREQVLSRVYRTRPLHYGGDIHGQIEVPPLALVAGTTLNFFQFHYSYREGDNLHRVIGWAHPALLQLLRYRKTSIFIDGTFRCVPVPFYQYVVVMCHDIAMNCYVPVFYALATGRSHTAYWNILHFLIVATDHHLDPESVTCDFEAALIAAIRDQMPTTTINGCLFHWKQAIRRRIRKLRIGQQESGFAMERGAINMLTVIPVDQVATLGKVYVQRYIQRRCEEERVTYSTVKWQSFWTYFDRTWVETFPVELWNIHGIDHDIINRTNNPLERFNRELNAAFPTPHPSLPMFVATIDRISRQRVQFLADVLARRAAPPRHQPFQLPVPVRLA